MGGIGAEITVVPRMLVAEGQLRPDTIEIQRATGPPVLAQMADENFNVLGYKFTQTVAVATPDMTLDYVLFSAEVPPDFAKQLLAYACANAAAKQTYHAVIE